MGIDSKGKNLAAVGVPFTGNAAICPTEKSFTVPTSDQFGKKDYKLPADFINLGLRPTDGAPEWTDETEGDAIQFYEDGYEVASSQTSVSCVMTLAETSPLLIELKHGVTLDANGVGDLGFSGNPKRWWLYTEDISKNVNGDWIIQRKLAQVAVSEVVENKPDKSGPNTWQMTFKAYRCEELGGMFMRYAQIHPTAVAPASTPASS